jgi:hypothetical protein
MAGFPEAVKFVIDELEGGSKIVGDSGGLTKYGISSRAHPGIDVVNLTRAEAEDIYKREYWPVVDFYRLRWPMSLVIFDTAVNQGENFAIEVAHGSWSVPTALLMRIQRYADIAEKNPLRRQYFMGWVNRVLKVWHRTQGQ